MGSCLGRDTGCAESGCFPRARLDERGRRLFPEREELMLLLLDYYWIIIANSQELLSRYMNVILNYCCV